MKARRNLLAVLFAVALGMSLSVPAGADSGPSPRVRNMQTLYSYVVTPGFTQVFPASGVSPVDALFIPSPQGRIASPVRRNS
jgi:hypothetical protein